MSKLNYEEIEELKEKYKEHLTHVKDTFSCKDIQNLFDTIEALENIKIYKCIKGFLIEKYDDNGFTLEGEYCVIKEGTIWHIPEDINYRFIGGEVRLESDEFGWLEVTNNSLKEHFKEL